MASSQTSTKTSATPSVLAVLTRIHFSVSTAITAARSAQAQPRSTALAAEPTPTYTKGSVWQAVPRDTLQTRTTTAVLCAIPDALPV